MDFILIGGVAAATYGSTHLTQDVDVVYARNPENLVRLTAALAPLDPRLRGAAPGLQFRWSVEILEGGLNFTLTTALGDLYLLGEIAGGGRYEDLFEDTIVLRVFGIQCRCVTLPP